MNETNKQQILFGYMRSSPGSPPAENQRELIQKWADLHGIIVKEYFKDDQISGKTINRPDFIKMLSRLSEVDGFVAIRLDRIARSLKELALLVDELDKIKKVITTVDGVVNSGTTTGRLVCHMFGALAEWEREVILEKTAIGRQRYLANGGKLGRKPLPLDKESVIALRKVGLSERALAKKYGASRKAISNALKRWGYKSSD